MRYGGGMISSEISKTPDNTFELTEHGNLTLSPELQLVEQSQSYTESCTGSSYTAADSATSGVSNSRVASQAYVWGSNSSRQLADSSQDKDKVRRAMKDI